MTASSHRSASRNTRGHSRDSRVATDDFRDAMASFPSGVTIVTTTDAEGRLWGFTASSFCSLSNDPALTLVCLAKKAECHAAFESTEKWAIHFVPASHHETAMRFATRGADKFADTAFAVSDTGLPILAGAAVVLECSAWERHPSGDHTILIGQVDKVTLGEDRPSVYFRRAFHQLAAS